MPESVDLSSPSLYINRKLSLLEFQRCVWKKRRMSAILARRLNFLAIFARTWTSFHGARLGIASR
jgi:polyphosphate kinase